jgi:hypothetical protein
MATPLTRTSPQGPVTKTARSHPARRSNRWYGLAVLAGVFAAILYLGASGPLGRWLAPSPSEQATSASSDELRTGKIVLEINPGQCEQTKFDNSSGRFTESLTPCENRIRFDEHGKPIPLGTIHRLDAISRSFSGH